MYENIIIYSNKLLLFVWPTLNKEKEKKQKTLINIYDGAFTDNSGQLKAVSYFSKKLSLRCLTKL